MKRALAAVLATTVFFLGSAAAISAAGPEDDPVRREVKIHEVFADNAISTAEGMYSFGLFVRSLYLAELGRQTINELEAVHLPRMLDPEKRRLVAERIVSLRRRSEIVVNDWIGGTFRTEIMKIANDAVKGYSPEEAEARMRFKLYEITARSLARADDHYDRDLYSDALYEIEFGRQAARLLENIGIPSGENDEFVIPPPEQLNAQVISLESKVMAKMHPIMLQAMAAMRQLTTPVKKGI